MPASTVNPSLLQLVTPTTGPQRLVDAFGLPITFPVPPGIDGDETNDVFLAQGQSGPQRLVLPDGTSPDMDAAVLTPYSLVTPPGVQVLQSAPAPEFSPRDVPEIANGLFYLPGDTVGFGTSSFRVVEGNGHSDLDVLSASIGAQPTRLGENGQTQFRMRNAANANPSTLGTSGNFRAGWTGATGALGWWRLPDNGGVPTGTSGLLQHTLTTGNQRRIFTNTILTALSSNFTLSVDGTNPTNSVLRTTTPLIGGQWIWLEFYYDPFLVLGGAGFADKMKIFANFQLLPQVTVPLVDVTSLFDGLAPLSIGCNQAAGVLSAPADTIDWAACYYTNGIATLSNRIRTANHRSPVPFHFS